MTLVQSWVDSLSLLKPKNLQLFMMVTIKATLEAYKLYFKYFWWLLFSLGGLFFIAPNYVASYLIRDMKALASYATILGVARLLYSILFLAICFATRPSIMQKNCMYFREQFGKFLLYWLMIFSAIANKFTGLFVLSSYSVAYIFFVLFFADSDGGLKSFFLSLWNTLKMIVYNAPLLVIMGFAFYVPMLIVCRLLFDSPLLTIIVKALLLPIGVCTYSNIYIKKLHDQFDLYFKKAQ